jgi:hypothetical protein
MLSMMKFLSTNLLLQKNYCAKNIILRSSCQGVRLEGDVCEDRFFWKPQTTFWSLWFLKLSGCTGLATNHYEWRGEFDETNPEKLAKIRILDGVRCSWQGCAAPSFAMFPVW